jgi:ribosomal protein S18 acetylase RimI-like enzyme
MEMSKFHEALHPHFILAEDCIDRYSSFIRSQLKQDNVAIFVYEDTGKITGMIKVKIENRPPVYRTTSEGFIQEISVASEAQRRGIGKKLVQFKLCLKT